MIKKYAFWLLIITFYFPPLYSNNIESDFEEIVDIEEILEQEAENNKLVNNFSPMIEESLGILDANLNEKKYTKIQMLNKITGKFYEVTINAKQEVSFGTLKIRAFKCFEIPNAADYEYSALIEVDDIMDQNDNKIFYGWMYAKNPSISVLEHPLYDVVVKSCLDN